MARNKIKNMKIEQDELKPITIGVFESRKKNSIGVFIILTIFVLVIFFLPQISDIVNEYLHPTVNTPVKPVNPVNPEKPEEPNITEDKLYPYIDTLKIENEDITIDTFLLDTTNKTISYVITNNGASIDIEDLNYYLEIYNSDKTLLERVKLASDLNLASGTFRKLTKDIKDSTVSEIGYIALVKKTIDEYPELELTSFVDGTGSIVCTKEHEKVTYKFEKNKLKELTSEVTYQNTDIDYESIYESQSILVNTYNNKVGITSTMFKYDAGHNITTTVNLSEASRTYIFNADTFTLDTEPKVVSFEMEAQNFLCE